MPRSAGRPANHVRNNELAQIHIGKAYLMKRPGFDDAAYRDMLFTVARVRSAADLDWAGRKRVIDHMIKCGAPLGRHVGAPSTLNRTPLLQKIEALLADMQLPWSYADKIAENITGGKAGGIARLDWVKEVKHLQAVIAALTYEQEKRALLADVDALLRAAGKTRDDVTARVAEARIKGATIKGDWTRNRATLKQLVRAIPQWWPTKGICDE